MRRSFSRLVVFLSIVCSHSEAEESPSARIGSREFPSVFQAWNPAEVKNADPEELEARHDLIFHAPDFFGLRWEGESEGMSTRFTPESVEAARARRQRLIQRNPNLILLAELRYRDAPRSYLPEGSPWWQKDAEGRPVVGWEEGGYLLLDFASEGFRNQVAAQARAVMATGVVDGIFLDWWEDDDDRRVMLARAIREAIGPDALILVNANARISPRTAQWINGHFMECDRSASAEDWKRITASLDWAEENLRKPRINCLETWFENSRQDLGRMRATTALALTHSDGYVLFSDPNPLPTPDHAHDWYSFWDASLGRSLAAGAIREDGSSWRSYQNGWVIYNPEGNTPVEIKLDSPCIRRSTGERVTSFTLPSLDGEILLKAGSPR